MILKILAICMPDLKDISNNLIIKSKTLLICDSSKNKIIDSSTSDIPFLILDKLISNILQKNKTNINNNNYYKLSTTKKYNLLMSSNLSYDLKKMKKRKNIIKSLDIYNETIIDKNKDMEYLIGNNKDCIESLLTCINNTYYINNFNDENFNGKLYDHLQNYNADSPTGILYGIASGDYVMPIIEPISIKEKVNIDMEINNISDLLHMIEKYPIISNVEYNINLENIHNIKEPLEDLDRMIGMSHLKSNIVDQILYFVQDLHNIKSAKGKNEGDFMHTVIYGPPGTGKTEIARIMGQIFSKLGVLKKGTFKKATRSDLIAGFLGQTSIKTKDLIKECLDGVLFIDEAYALGNPEKRDSFAKECIDTLCESLSDYKNRIMVIIAGYETELNQCFFSYNQGLESRFTWRFKTDDYNAEELMNIFIKKVKENGWSIKTKDDIKLQWFEENKDYFKYYGRDMETLFSKTKIAHSRRVFCKPLEEKTQIIKVDLEKGFEMYIDNEEVKSRKDDILNSVHNTLYM
jgi:SpoVK/Ycf46/Vps4 family AAA+-type ATPase